jgi:translation initiation factor IF-2
VELIGLENAAGRRPLSGGERRPNAQEIVATRIEKVRTGGQAGLAAPRKMTLEDLYGKTGEDGAKELLIVLKADVQGSLEALKQSLGSCQRIKSASASCIPALGDHRERCPAAAASSAVVIGFNVRPGKGQTVARARGPPRTGSSTRRWTTSAPRWKLLAPTLKEQSLGRAEVRQVFMIPRVGAVAGSYVLQGVITRASSGVRVVRDGVVVYQGKLGSLRRFKDDVREVQSGYECGIGVENFNDLKVGDVLEAFTIEKVAAKL